VPPVFPMNCPWNASFAWFPPDCDCIVSTANLGSRFDFRPRLQVLLPGYYCVNLFTCYSPRRYSFSWWWGDRWGLFSMGATRTPLDYLATSSQMALESVELSRLNHAANLRKELHQVVEEWIESEVDARFAHAILEWRRGESADPAGGALASAVEGIFEQAPVRLLPPPREELRGDSRKRALAGDKEAALARRSAPPDVAAPVVILAPCPRLGRPALARAGAALESTRQPHAGEAVENTGAFGDADHPLQPAPTLSLFSESAARTADTVLCELERFAQCPARSSGDPFAISAAVPRASTQAGRAGPPCAPQLALRGFGLPRSCHERASPEAESGELPLFADESGIDGTLVDRPHPACEAAVVAVEIVATRISLSGAADSLRAVCEANEGSERNEGNERNAPVLALPVRDTTPALARPPLRRSPARRPAVALARR